MENRYVTDEGYRTQVKMFTSLSFVVLNDTVPRFGTLAENFINNFGDEVAHHEFLDYMERTWIGRPGRRSLFPPSMWNCRETTLLHLPRTINSLESWHHAIQAIYNSPHPNLYKFIEGIQLEHVRVNATCVKLDAGLEVPLYSRREYRQANERLLKVLERYAEMDSLRFLRAASHYVKYNGADPIQDEEENDTSSESEEHNDSLSEDSINFE
jgi:hypothetical protein